MTTEFRGDDAPSGLPRKPKDALTASEKLRLAYTTGTEDPEAPLNNRAWHGQKNEMDPEIKKLFDNS